MNQQITIHPTSMSGQSIFVVYLPGDGDFPTISMQMPSFIARWLKESVERAHFDPADFRDSWEKQQAELQRARAFTLSANKELVQKRFSDNTVFEGDANTGAPRRIHAYRRIQKQLFSLDFSIMSRERVYIWQEYVHPSDHEINALTALAYDIKHDRDGRIIAIKLSPWSQTTRTGYDPDQSCVFEVENKDAKIHTAKELR